MENAKTPEVSVVIAVHNREDLISQCLDSVLRQQGPEFEIIVVDDGSSDQTADRVQAFQDGRIRFHRNDFNRGLMHSRNRGVALSAGTLIAFIDSDGVADPQWLSELLAPFYNDPDIMITGGRVNPPAVQNYWQKVDADGDFIAQRSGYVKRVIGCSMAFRRDFLAANPFDETLKYGGDELDLCLRARAHKKKIFYTDAAKVVHYHRKTFVETLKKRWRLGYGNTYVRIKNSAFPHLNYGTYIILNAFILAILFHHWWASILGIGILAFSFLVFCVHFRARPRNIGERCLTYPGFYLTCLADCAGNLAYVYDFVRKRAWKSHGSA